MMASWQLIHGYHDFCGSELIKTISLSLKISWPWPCRCGETSRVPGGPETFEAQVMAIKGLFDAGATWGDQCGGHLKPG